MRVALIAHEEMKPTLVELARDHRETLEGFDLLATDGTGERLGEATGLDVERKESGRYGGDLQIGAEVAAGACDLVVFLRDPLTAQPHEPDITALMRICDVRDIPLATNRASAEALLSGMSPG